MRQTHPVYTNPRPAEWPAADFIVGNPPFIGNKRMREDLGDGYAETLRAAYPEVSETADFVLYWWQKAAELTRTGRVKRFGLITTNSLRQTFARRVVQAQLSAKPPLSLLFAIPDHPWVDTTEGAAVRIAMTVGTAGDREGELLEVTGEEPQPDGSEKITFNSRRGKIAAELSIGANSANAKSLQANEDLSFMGVTLVGDFRITQEDLADLGYSPRQVPNVVKPYVSGKELTQEPCDRFVADFFGLSLEDARRKYPELLQLVMNRVKPLREHNKRDSYREKWWIFGEPRTAMRDALAGLNRYIATLETSKHRIFVFLNGDVVPDHTLFAIAHADAFLLGVLSSRIHIVWSLTAGSTLEDRPRWRNLNCFNPFPFPLCGAEEKERIRKLAEELDAHRKRVQAQHGLTLTGLYNVLEKLRAGEPLTDKEKLVHDKGLVSVLKQLHDDLDAAVFAAYGWVRAARATGEVEPEPLTDEEILERLVALNAQRAAEEKRGVIHWLRPEYQAGAQSTLNLKPSKAAKPAKKTKATPAPRKSKTKAPWPKALAERVQAVEAALHAAAAPVTPAELAAQFARAKPEDVLEILQTLDTLGRAHKAGEGRYRR